jgi:hypothetical protein
MPSLEPAVCCLCEYGGLNGDYDLPSLNSATMYETVAAGNAHSCPRANLLAQKIAPESRCQKRG